NKISQFHFQNELDKPGKHISHITIKLVDVKLSKRFFDLAVARLSKGNGIFDSDNVCMIATYDLMSYHQAMALLHEFDPLDDYTRMEITFLHHVDLISDNEIKNKFGRLLHIAKYSDQDMLWFFTQRCKIIFPNDISKLISCFKNIPLHSIHLKEANQALLSLLRSGQVNKKINQKLYYELCTVLYLKSDQLDLTLDEKALIKSAKAERQIAGEKGVAKFGIYAPTITPFNSDEKKVEYNKRSNSYRHT
ncbi:MAG: hypothetical protein JO149_02885, partial [Gammaproteobacteria bacterium]|nr:hypothetical protein [Gammaproteobacteria bacterium]